MANAVTFQTVIAPQGELGVQVPPVLYADAGFRHSDVLSRGRCGRA